MNILGSFTRLFGRALEWHSRGQEFDPLRLHQKVRGFLPRIFYYLLLFTFTLSNYLNYEQQHYIISLKIHNSKTIILLDKQKNILYNSL